KYSRRMSPIAVPNSTAVPTMLPKMKPPLRQNGHAKRRATTGGAVSCRKIQYRIASVSFTTSIRPDAFQVEANRSEDRLKPDTTALRTNRASEPSGLDRNAPSHHGVSYLFRRHKRLRRVPV